MDRKQPIEIQDSETNPIKVEWKKTENSNIEDVFLSCDGGSYYAILLDNILYGGQVEVNADKRRQGIATQLITKLVEVANERGINIVYHHAQSSEGLELIKNKLPIPNRMYLDSKLENQVSYEEAMDILKRKKEEGEQLNTSIFVQTTTYIDRLET